MKTSILTMAIASSFILGACHSTFEQKTQNVQTELAQSTSEPELGIFGLELAARNVTIKPGDDFFMYASGTWYDNFEMPSDKTRYGAFSVLADRNEERVKQIIDDISKAKDLSFEEHSLHGH
jgi:putative endopeptidase